MVHLNQLNGDDLRKIKDIDKLRINMEADISQVQSILTPKRKVEGLRIPHDVQLLGTTTPASLQRLKPRLTTKLAAKPSEVFDLGTRNLGSL